MGRGAKRKVEDAEDVVARLRPDSTHDNVFSWLRDGLKISEDVLERVRLQPQGACLQTLVFDIAGAWRVVLSLQPTTQPCWELGSGHSPGEEPEGPSGGRPPRLAMPPPTQRPAPALLQLEAEWRGRNEVVDGDIILNADLQLLLDIGVPRTIANKIVRAVQEQRVATQVRRVGGGRPDCKAAWSLHGVAYLMPCAGTVRGQGTELATAAMLSAAGAGAQHPAGGRW